MHLYFIRHAQSANNDLYTRTGSSLGRAADPPLTDLGHQQARTLAQHLSHSANSHATDSQLVGVYASRHDRLGYGLTHLYCSLMTRAVQTGSYVSAATGLTLRAWPEIHERGGLHLMDATTGEDLGIPGPGRDYFEQGFPFLALPEGIGTVGWWNRPIETIADSYARAKLVWGQLLDRHGDTEDRVAIISHAGFFQSLMKTLMFPSIDWSMEGEALGYLWFGVSNVSISRFELSGGEVVVRYINRVDYLPDELVSG